MIAADMSFWREVIDKLPGILTALASIVAAIGSILNRRSIGEVHKVVNNQNTALLTKNVELTDANQALRQDKADIIRVAGNPPVDPSKLPPNDI